MTLLFLLPVLTLLWHLRPGEAYLIDPVSCKGAQLKLMEKAVPAAFQMSRSAIAALTPNLRDDNVRRLFELLYGEGVDPTPLRAILNRIFTLQNRRLTPTDPVMQTYNEVVFYCNMDRIKERIGQDGKKRWTDTVTQTAYDGNDGEAIDSCKAATDFTLAESWVPPSELKEGPPNQYLPTPSQITMCPWFLEWAVNEEYQTLEDVSWKSIAAKVLIPALSQLEIKYPLTEIDALNLLDKVILHELAHTTTAGKLDDVKIDSGPLGLGVAYGWNAATDLAKQNRLHDESAMNNADTLALFASGVRLLDEQPPLYIENDGTVSKNSRNAKQRRLSKRIVQRTTPVAFEAFLGRIKALRMDAFSLS